VRVSDAHRPDSVELSFSVLSLNILKMLFVKKNTVNIDKIEKIAGVSLMARSIVTPGIVETNAVA
jgi:hypothetical protein